MVSQRVPANQWLGTQSRQVIVGEPGAGKSTLLRYLVLDLLSEHPRWQPVAARWGTKPARLAAVSFLHATDRRPNG